MPTPLQRALASAPVKAAAAKSHATREVFTFRLGDLTLGVESLNVREVTRSGPLTPLPRAPSFLLGVSGQRGEVLPVVDLLRFFGRGETQVTDRTRIFVGVHQTWSVAFVADVVVGLSRIDETAIHAPPATGGDLPLEFLMGVVVSAGEPPIALLNLPRLLTAAHKRAVTR